MNLKENLNNPLSQEGIKELEDVFEIIGFSSDLNQVKTNFAISPGPLLLRILSLKQI